MNSCLLFWRCLGQRSTQGEQSRAQGAQDECLLHHVYTLAGYVSIPSHFLLTIFSLLMRISFGFHARLYFLQENIFPMRSRCGIIKSSYPIFSQFDGPNLLK
jgi:hypothetical protein